MTLASSFYKQEVSNFSIVIQGSGATGKAKSVIMAVKKFVEPVCVRTECEVWRKYLLILVPNLVAMDVGGVAIDSTRITTKCSALVKLVIVDEYSMVSLG